MPVAFDGGMTTSLRLFTNMIMDTAEHFGVDGQVFVDEMQRRLHAGILVEAQKETEPAKKSHHRRKSWAQQIPRS